MCRFKDRQPTVLSVMGGKRHFSVSLDPSQCHDHLPQRSSHRFWAGVGGEGAVGRMCVAVIDFGCVFFLRQKFPGEYSSETSVCQPGLVCRVPSRNQRGALTLVETKHRNSKDGFLSRQFQELNCGH